MKIIKYLFLLLLLSFVALSIFIATQKGDFQVERNKIINSPKSSVYNYVNDLNNWEDFGSWITEDPTIKIEYSQKTIGNGASYNWEGKDGTGEIKTISCKENNSIIQKMDFNGSPSTINWNFKDTIGGTKVTWKTKGSMSFLFKIYAALNGGVDKVIGTMYEKSLNNLDKALDYEISTYSVKENGLSNRPITNYLSQSFTSEISKVHKNFKIVIPKILEFCKTNNIIVVGKPFIVFHTYDIEKKIAKISICVSIKDEIFISAGSDISSGKLEQTEAVKTTLYGDYSHSQKAIDKAISFLNRNTLRSSSNINHIEIYTVGKKEEKKPSKWVTEFYIPIAPKIIPVKSQTLDEPTSEIETTEEPATEITNSKQAIKTTNPIIKKSEVKAISKPAVHEEKSEF